MSDNLKSLNRRNLILGGAFCAVSGLAYARTPQVRNPQLKKEAFDDLVPKTIGSWQFETSSGLVLPPPDALSDRLYDNLVTRVYSSPTQPTVMLLTAYSNTQDGVLQVHRPEVCYPAGGYDLSETEVITVDNGLGGTLPANLFTASRPGRAEHVLYWTRIGNEFPLAWSDQRLAVIRANLRGDIPDGILVRVSAVLPEGTDAVPILSSFAAEMNRTMGAKGRALISGIGA